MGDTYELTPQYAGMNLLVGKGNATTQYVLNGVLTDYTAAELLAKNNMQDGQYWSMPSRSVLDSRVLSDVQAAKTRVIAMAYANALSQNVSFTTAGGVTQTFQADQNSQTILVGSTQGYSLAGSVPSGFYWVAADNTQVPFTLADLKGLYETILAQGWIAFQRYQTQKAAVRATTTIAAAQAIGW